MMRHTILIASLCLSVLSLSCGTELQVIVPDVESLQYLDGTTPVPIGQRRLLEGIFQIDDASQRFGTTVVLKHDGETLSMFSARNVSYMVLQSGIKDSTIRFAGYWRFAQGSETGLCILEISPDDGARDILNGQRPKSLTLRGFTGGPSERPRIPVTMKYQRAIKARTGGFWIIAHRGGGRNSDRLPYSENSLELIRYASKLGANGVEIDIKLTKDRVPILYHDATFNTRLVDGEYLVGDIANYTYPQILALGTLKNGEKIPTLEESLKTIVERTLLSYVWLDVKDVTAMDTIIALQRKYLAYAASKGRQLEIAFGLPDETLYNRFRERSDYSNIPSICELGVEQTRTVNATVYAPRWTLGTQPDIVKDMQKEKRRCFVWTLDQPEFIVKYMQEGDFDGILTNYPTLVAYYQYVQP
ncbi:MAG: glycerophosphodiester phosphodiesterase [Candidatus Kapabacteria bacterium]|nr:glycerophosphodiester phosphodiesterase [Candidatus Kapabacteria bacterium]